MNTNTLDCEYQLNVACAMALAYGMLTEELRDMAKGGVYELNYVEQLFSTDDLGPVQLNLNLNLNPL